MSCYVTETQASGDGFNNDSSDYGSDFTPDEEELLNELLVQVATQHQSTTVTNPTTPPSIKPADLSDLKPLQEPLAVTDIEDYEVPQAVRVPKVLGREAWSPSPWTKRSWQHIPPWSRNAGKQSPGSMAWHSRSPIFEHANSIEGRQRELEKQQAREQNWIAERDANASGTPEPTSNNVNAPLSPIDRFRKPPNKAFSVSDLIAPAWCELQYWYTLTKHGRKRRTPAMKQGSAVHKTLEDEVHTTVPIEITTREDGWALRIWNVIQGLRTLRDFGMTRELEVWGLIDGEIVTGVIDQLSYQCPDPELEASAAKYYADAQTARAVLPEYQMSITDYLLSPSRKGKRITELGWMGHEESSEDAQEEEQSIVDIPRVYVTDIKTRAQRSIPTVTSSSFRPTHLQLQLYYHMLNRSATSDDVTIDTIAQRYNLDPERTFTDAFIAEVGSLNDQFFDAFSSQSSDPDYVPNVPGASQDSISILLAHNNLASLWDLMKEQLHLTFFPSPNNPFISPSIPSHSQPSVLEEYPTVLSPLLTAKYLSSTNTDSGMPEVLGSRSFLFDPTELTSYVSDQMNWWRGERAPRGVEVMDAWKCRICEFREECTWRLGKERELATRRRRFKKTAVEMLEA